MAHGRRGCPVAAVGKYDATLSASVARGDQRARAVGTAAIATTSGPRPVRPLVRFRADLQVLTVRAEVVPILALQFIASDLGIWFQGTAKANELTGGAQAGCQQAPRTLDPVYAAAFNGRRRRRPAVGRR